MSPGWSNADIFRSITAYRGIKTDIKERDRKTQALAEMIDELEARLKITMAFLIQITNLRLECYFQDFYKDKEPFANQRTNDKRQFFIRATEEP